MLSIALETFRQKTQSRARAAEAVMAGARLMLNRSPDLIGDYARIANVMYSTSALDVAVQTVRQNQSGRHALTDRRPTPKVEMERLRRCPDKSLGRELYQSLTRVGVSRPFLPGLPKTISLPSDPEHAYLIRHYFETHDIWHVVTGFAMNAPGEAGIHAFTAAQFPLRMDTLLVGIAFSRAAVVSYRDREATFDAVSRGWLAGRAGPSLVGVDWAPLFELPVVQVRRELGLPERGVAAESLPLPNVAALLHGARESSGRPSIGPRSDGDDAVGHAELGHPVEDAASEPRVDPGIVCRTPGYGIPREESHLLGIQS